MSQCDRVLALLRSRGGDGLNTAELQEAPIVDGGAPILRLAARVHQLQERGIAITSRREQNGTATYTLTEEGFPTGRIPPRTDGSTGVALAAGHKPASAFGNRAAIIATEIPADRHGGEGRTDSLFDPDVFADRGTYKDAA